MPFQNQIAQEKFNRNLKFSDMYCYGYDMYCYGYNMIHGNWCDSSRVQNIFLVSHNVTVLVCKIKITGIFFFMTLKTSVLVVVSFRLVVVMVKIIPPL